MAATSDYSLPSQAEASYRMAVKRWPKAVITQLMPPKSKWPWTIADAAAEQIMLWDSRTLGVSYRMKRRCGAQADPQDK
jgi:hypothetical protein